MHQGGDYTSFSAPPPQQQQSSYYNQQQYPQNPNPNLIPNPPPPLADFNSSLHGAQYASAPPFAPPSSDNYAGYSPNYPPFSHNSDFAPSLSPTAPSYLPNPNLQSQFNPPPNSTPPIQPQSSFPQFESHVPFQSQQYYPPFDQAQSNFGVPSNAGSDYNLKYNYDSGVNLDNSGGVNVGLGRYDSGGYGSGGGGGYGEGVYAYQGSKVEPYGARGTGSKSSTWSSSATPTFDDFGRPISFPSGKSQSAVSSGKIARAVPKAESEQDSKGGVQKFRVKLLAESSGQSTMDVLCQVGLDGIRMLDPSTSRTLRIYPLDTVTRCDVTDSSTFAFWSKSFVDIEPRRIRLQSNRYTTNTILDTVTAATVQLKEMGGGSRPSDSQKVSDQPSEKKKGLGDWMNLMKPVNEEKDHWVPDEAVTKCTACGSDFGAFVRRHHCRNCGDIFCDKCTHGRIALTADENAPQVRVCDRCMAEVTHRLSNAKDTATRSPASESHQDLAKKLQEEMERNRKSSSGMKAVINVFLGCALCLRY
ncbi:hypothetical protein AgCh_010362 [Apium graveolens]